MINLIVGHRGTGKSTLLERVTIYAQAKEMPFEVFDLDREIEKSTGRTIAEIFLDQGEDSFRQMESLTLDRLCQRAKPWKSTWIALGAGFQGPLPQGARILWLRRSTDQDGRIFFDRPSLDPKLSALEEYQARYQIRQERFSSWATQDYWMPEGVSRPSVWEAQILGFFEEPIGCGGVVTWLNKSQEELSRLMRFGPDQIELRDDLHSIEIIQRVREMIPPERVLLSLRQRPTFSELPAGSKVDWALELEGGPNFEPSILSRHQRLESLEQTLLELPKQSGALLKLAVEIRNFSELIEGHRWWCEDPKNRSFLPRSRDGRWLWYRTLMSSRVPLSFWREGQGSALDQPTLSDWLRFPKSATRFAALIGHPVHHSWTCIEQQDFFKERGLGVVAISMIESEMTNDNMNFLIELGLCAAAVTAPLKLKAYEWVEQGSELAHELQAVNTMGSHQGKWRGHNTDLEGFEALMSEEKGLETAVWGGSGTHRVIKRHLPHATFYRMRSFEKGNQRPKVLVWALGREHLKWPPGEWKPERVVDLNYTENSPGREYAKKIKAQYTSGERMFRAQAQAQREFWTKQSLD